MTGPSLGHRLEYFGVRVGAGLVRLLPEWAARRLGAALGAFSGSVLRIRADDVERHLRIAFPEATPERIRELRAKSFRHLGRQSAAMIRLAGMPAAELIRRTEVEGIEHLRAALASGRGAILVGGHLGNWEVGGAAIAARGIPLVGVARHQKNPLFDRWIKETRGQLGIRFLGKDDAAADAGAVLSAGGVLALIADQDARGRGIFVDFFGRPTSTPAGPAVFSLRYRVPMFLAIPLARTDRPGHTRVILEEVSLSAGVPRGRQAAQALTQAFSSGLERWIREAPEQYFWQHRRWKTAPPDRGKTEGS